MTKPIEQLTKAIIQVMKEVKGMEKNSRVGTGNNSYDGTKDVDVKEIFNEALAKNELCIVPTGVEEETNIERWEETNQYGTKTKQSVFTKVKTKYLLMHSSGQSIELAGYGQGVDAQDKGAGKATTYALKNCLLLTFLTPVGKMPDTDTDHSQEMEVPKKPEKKILVPANGKKYPSDKQFGDFQTRFRNGEDVLESMRENFLFTKEQEEWITSQI